MYEECGTAVSAVFCLRPKVDEPLKDRFASRADAGPAVIEERHFQTGFAAPHTFTMDVSRNWEPYPEFGDYESIPALHWSDQLSAVDRGSDIPV